MTRTTYRWACVICDEKFVKLTELRLHNVTHTGKVTNPKRVSTCQVCGKSVKDIKRHEKTHTGEKPFSCTYCDKKFIEDSYRLKHERIHIGDKPFSCTHCEKKFFTNSAKKDHEKIHSTDRPYVNCPECNKKLISVSYLEKHRKTHSNGKRKAKPCFCTNLRNKHNGEKLVTCSWCDKNIQPINQKTDGELVHTGEKQFSCATCDIKFLTNFDLEQHAEVVHTSKEDNEIIFNCKKCERKFTLLESLSDHELMMHPKTNIEENIEEILLMTGSA